MRPPLALPPALMLAAAVSAMSLAVFMTNPQRRWKEQPTATRTSSGREITFVHASEGENHAQA